MPAQNKSTPLPYTPGLPPDRVEDFSRAVWDELFKIAQALAQADRPMAVSLTDTELLAVAPAAPFVRLFDPAVIVWELPGAQVSATGVWTCPQEGLYQIDYSCEIAPASVPGNRAYTFELRRTRTFASGAPDEVVTLHDSGDDSYYLSITAPSLLRCLRGDTLVIDARATVAAGSTSVQARSAMQITRVSGVR